MRPTKQEDNVKSLVLRWSLVAVLVVGSAVALGQSLVTAQPGADSQLYLPLVSNMPTPTPTATATPTVLPPRSLTEVGPMPEGAEGGGPFRDNPPDNGNVTEIKVYEAPGVALYGIQLVLSTGPMDFHGTSVGSLNDIKLAPDEYIIGINGRGFAIVDQVSIVTNKTTYGPYGGEGGGPFSLSAPSGDEIVGFFGRSGWQIDQIGGLARVRR